MPSMMEYIETAALKRERGEDELSVCRARLQYLFNDSERKALAPNQTFEDWLADIDQNMKE